MSSSFRKPIVVAAVSHRRTLASASAIAALAFAQAAVAADYFVQPKIELRAETNSNRDLDVPPQVKNDGQAYAADLSAIVGIATPLSETTLRPRVRLQEFSKNSEAKTFEGGVDLRSRYKTQRSTFNILGRFDHKDTSNSERASPQVDDLDPNDPTAPQSGIVDPGETRNLLQVRPDYTFRATERVGIGLGAQYQNVRYSGGGNSRVDYDYMQGRTFVTFDTGQRSSITVGPYASKYEAKSGNGVDTDAYGVQVDYQMKVSERLEARLSGGWERNKTKSIGPTPVSDKSNGWIAAAGITYKGEVSSLNLTVGHVLTPSGTGKTESNQVQIRYERDLSQRMSFDLVGHYNDNKAVSSLSNASDWNYGTVEGGLEWKITQTWYVRGGVAYERERYDVVGRSANNTSVFLAIGYEGLGRQRK